MITICNFLRWFCLQSVNRAHAFHGCAVDTQRTHQLHTSPHVIGITVEHTIQGHRARGNKIGAWWRLAGGGYRAVEWGRIGRVLRACALVLGNTPATKPLKIPSIPHLNNRSKYPVHLPSMPVYPTVPPYYPVTPILLLALSGCGLPKMFLSGTAQNQFHSLI